MTTIHLAGQLSEEGVQFCERCGYVLTDYRSSMVPVGTPSMKGFPCLSSVEVSEGNPKYMVVTDENPNCVKSSN